MITKESIINWLKENDIFERVSNNVEKCTAEKIGISYTLDQLLDVMFKAKLPIRNFLTMAFDWRMVPEEYDFWEEKNIAFREYVQQEFLILYSRYPTHLSGRILLKDGTSGRRWI